MKKSETSLIIVFLLFLSCSNQNFSDKHFLIDHGAFVRGDTTLKKLSLIFTGGDFNDGGFFIHNILEEKKIKANFFFTGDFYRRTENSNLIFTLLKHNHYLGPHSDKHLLYCSWQNRDSLLITKQEFVEDILNNYAVMADYGIKKEEACFFIPPFEWFNDSISVWSDDLGLTLFNFTPGTASNADYTTPEMNNYLSSAQIYTNIVNYEKSSPNGINGFILLLHIGAHPNRADKFYFRLPELIDHLHNLGYNFVRIDQLLSRKFFLVPE